MADTNMQTIEGGSLLSSLARLFFNGLENALTAAAEYEEEMGVLKQVNRIELSSVNDDNKTYTLTIKLSPVRGKDSYYFVEAETDAPGLDVSKINNKTMKIDKTNVGQFRRLIDNLISSSKYAASMDRSDEALDDAEVVGEPAEGEEQASKEGDITAEGAVQSLIDAAKDRFDGRTIVATASDGTFVEILLDFESNNKDSCRLTLTATDAQTNKIIDSIKPDKIDIDVTKDDGKFIDSDMFISEIYDAVEEFSKDHNFVGLQYAPRSAVAATFIKDKDGIGLTAVRASSDLNKTMEIIYNLMDSDEFVNQIPEDGEASFEIVEENDDYSIDPVDEVDVSNTKLTIYQVVSKMYITMKSVQSMVGFKNWESDEILSQLYLAVVSLQTEVATWAVQSDVLSILQDPFKLVPTFEQYRDLGSSDTNQIRSIIVGDITTKFLPALEFLEVNLDEEKQSVIDLFTARILDMLN